MHWLDGLVVLSYFVVIIGMAIYYSRKSGQGTDEFFLSGRNLPWWIAGTAMVATTFAADTPLAVTELVARNGIAGNWLWWNMAIGSMLTVFFFAKLWRRATILTDVEFAELRYSGKPAAWLRGIRAIYLGLLMNAIVLAWVNKAMQKIFSVLFPTLDAFWLVVICMIIVAIYASASGMLGTARTDALQFAIAMAGCIVLAIVVVNMPETGGIAGLKARLPEWVFSFTPIIGDGNLTRQISGGVMAMSSGAFLAHLGLQWWASWYPGADPGGGGYIAQRMMSAKDEKHSLFSTLWFTIAHYTLRPWPWILVALVALVVLPRAATTIELEKENPGLYQHVAQVYQSKTLHTRDAGLKLNPGFMAFYEKYENTVDPGIMYPKLMVRYLPAGLLGLLIAVFLAAYMSTIASQLNWGTSYIINDFYRRFIKPNAKDAYYVKVSRITMLVLSIVSLLVTRYVLDSIAGAWEFVINASAGIGAVLILRWFWWRINAWSEISALIAPLIIYPIARYGFGIEPPITLFPTVIGTTIIWILATLVTAPVSDSTLQTFYQKVHPGGIGWKPLRLKFPQIKPDSGYGKLLASWIAGVVMIYSALFGVGYLILKNYQPASLSLAFMVVSILVILRMKSWENL